MKKRIIIFLLTTLSLTVCSDLFAQAIETRRSAVKNTPIDIALGNFSVGLPFSKVLIHKFYPIATLGTEFYYRNKKHSQIYQAVKIGGYYTKYNTSALFVNTEIGYRYILGFGLFADANLGAGYSHLFRPNAIYKSNEGEYKQIRDWGKPSLMADFSLSAGYDFSKKLNKPVSVFARYSNLIQLFYNADIPVLPQNSFQIGTRFLINQNKKSNEIK